jgi:YHS domain-containing protein
MEKSTRSPTVYIDPVCLMKVDSGKRDLMYTHRMRTYYFCAEFCRKTFEKNPDKYLSTESPKRKGLWGRYLERLNKATGGKAPDCH